MQRGGRQQEEQALATRAAWLSYVGRMTQEDIATRLGVSRVKANRLIAQAHRDGLIRVFVEGPAANCIELEQRLLERHQLDLCVVAPDLGESDLPLETLSAAGARFLLGMLEQRTSGIIGFGHGRTLAAVVDRLPRLTASELKFVSLIGSLTRKAAAHPSDVIHRLAERVSGEAYFMPVPFIADSAEDKAVLVAQKSIIRVFEMARSADLFVVGIGEVLAHSHLVEAGMMTMAELEALRRAGAAGELLGQFVDAGGNPVNLEINDRAIGLTIEDLRGKDAVAIAGGRGKARAIDAVLRSRVLTGLITDEATARRLVELRDP